MVLTNPRTSATFDPVADTVSLHVFDPETTVGAVIELSPDRAAELVNQLLNARPLARKDRGPRPTRAERSTFHLRIPRLSEADTIPIRRR